MLQRIFRIARNGRGSSLVCPARSLSFLGLNQIGQGVGFHREANRKIECCSAATELQNPPCHACAP